MNRRRLLYMLLGLPFLAAPLEAAPDAEATGKSVRAALPEPRPDRAFQFEGDVVVKELWAGTVKIAARARRFGRKPMWEVVEDVFIDWGGSEVRWKTKLHLGRDLRLSGGTIEIRSKNVTVSKVFGPGKKGLEVGIRRRKGDGPDRGKTRQLKAPEDVIGGLAALVLLLRGVGEDGPKSLSVPWLDPGRGIDDDAQVGRAQITVKGARKFGSGKRARESRLYTIETPRGTMQLHLEPDGRNLIGAEGPAPDEHIVPKGWVGMSAQFDENAPARTWQAAFLKFGYGYHMANAVWLEAAFHWDRMHRYESEVAKSWPSDKPVAEFKKAWIKEFVANSKHRSRFDTERLLNMTLASGKVKEQTDERVVFAAHKNFGGGVQRTYHLEAVKGVWGIVRIDF